MATINGVYHPTDNDPYRLTGAGAGDGDLGAMAASAAHKAVDAAAAAAEDAWNRRWEPVRLAFDADLNTVTEAGEYIVRSLSIINRPAGEVFGSLTVQPFGTTAVLQTFTAGYDIPQVWVRRSNVDGTAWDEWVRIDAGRWEAVTLAADADLNTITDQGYYIVRNLSIANRPGGEVFGSLEVQPFGPTAVLQTFTAGYATPEVWVRRSNVDGTAWDEWVQIGATPEPSGNGMGALRRDLLQQGLRARKGGTIGTGGLGVVALRFDDAAGDFARDVLPLLVERGLPFTRVTTTDRVGNTAGGEDDTWANIQDYCLEHGGEVWNHGKTHGAAITREEIDAEVSGALATLRANLPRIPIDCWSPPGGQTTNWDGYMPAETIEQLTESYAGQQIMAHHALTSGYLTNTWYPPLDGVMRDGQIFYSCDIRDYAFIETVVNRARDYPSGVTIMFHANNIGESGHVSMADFVAILDHIVAERDAGNLLVLTVSGMAVADALSDRREDLLRTHSGASWSEQVLFPAARRQIPGSTRELTATVTGTAGATVTSVVGSSTKEHTIPAGGTLLLHHPVTIPLDVTSLPVSITGGATTGARLMPV